MGRKHALRITPQAVDITKEQKTRRVMLSPPARQVDSKGNATPTSLRSNRRRAVRAEEKQCGHSVSIPTFVPLVRALPLDLLAAPFTAKPNKALSSVIAKKMFCCCLSILEFSSNINCFLIVDYPEQRLKREGERLMRMREVRDETWDALCRRVANSRVGKESKMLDRRICFHIPKLSSPGDFRLSSVLLPVGTGHSSSAALIAVISRIRVWQPLASYRHLKLARRLPPFFCPPPRFLNQPTCDPLSASNLEKDCCFSAEYSRSECRSRDRRWTDASLLDDSDSLSVFAGG
ncbi:hypothetical protein KSP40_PGU013852 [Platanthera guangdongensis]|uniref:Uncharacterized protein n=1 Tax=Platanthera guangdongensis TaxID=2320717 RepID=A0ABR2LZA0_9ASPA